MPAFSKQIVIKKSLEDIEHLTKKAHDNNSFNTYVQTILPRIDLINSLVMHNGDENLYNLVKDCNRDEIRFYTENQDIDHINNCIGMIKCTVLQDC